MQITREQIKTMIREEIEETLKNEEHNPLYSRHKGSKLKGSIDPVTGKKKLKMQAPESEDEKARREQDLYKEEELEEDNPLYSKHKGSKLKGSIDPVTGKKKLKMQAPESEDEKQRRQQDLYKEEELQERIFKVLVNKIRGVK